MVLARIPQGGWPLVFSLVLTVSGLDAANTKANCYATVAAKASRPPTPQALARQIRTFQKRGKDPFRFSPEAIAEEWDRYDSYERTPGMARIPPNKVNPTLRKNLSLILTGRISKRSARTFLRKLDKINFELWELSHEMISQETSRQEKRESEFVCSAVINLWRRHKQQVYASGGDLIPKPPQQDLLSGKLDLVLWGELSDETTLEFLSLLRSVDSDLYQVFFEMVKDHWAPTPWNLWHAQTERWAEEWSEWFQVHSEELMVPEEEEDPWLEEALAFIREGGLTQEELIQFRQALFQENRVLFEFTNAEMPGWGEMSIEKVRRPPDFDPVATARQWNFYFAKKETEGHLYPTRRENPLLNNAINKILSGARNPLLLKNLKALVRENNATLYWYLNYLSEKRARFDSQGRDFHHPFGEFWAFKWISYYRLREEGEPEIPPDGLLRSSLREFFRKYGGTVEETAFQDTLKRWEPALYRFYRRRLKQGVFSFDNRRQVTDYGRWAREWIIYYRQRSPRTSVFPTFPYNRPLFSAIRRFRDGEMSEESRAGILNVLEAEAPNGLYLFAKRVVSPSD